MRIFRQRALLISVIGLCIFLALLAESFDRLATQHREQVQQELQKALGKDVSFERLRVSLFAGFGFSAKGFRVSDDARFAATPLLQAKELILGVSPWNLLLGRVVIDSMTLKEPEFQVITNEQGMINLMTLPTRKSGLGAFPRLRVPHGEHRAGVDFLVSRVRVEDGRIAYVDRSISEPAEVQIRNVQMDIKGFDPAERTRFTLAAALSEGLSRDVRIDGFIGPVKEGQPWLQQPIEMQVKLDSLYVPFLARAIAFLRDKIPRELDVTGPMALRMKIAGPIGSPRISNLSLNVPLFGSTEYNAIVSGSIDLTGGKSWPEARINAKVVMNHIDTKQLRRLPLLAESLPAEMATDGPINIYGRVEGSWNRLRMGALIQADKAEFTYRDWLRKPAGMTARMQFKISREAYGLVFHPAWLLLGDSRLSYSGGIADLSAPDLQLRLYGAGGRVSALSRLIPSSPISASAGQIGWNVAFSKDLAAARSWNVRGTIRITGARLRHKSSGRKIDDLNAEIYVSGTQAWIEAAAFQLGSSRITLTGSTPDIASLHADYEMRSPDLKLSDVAAVSGLTPSRLKDVAATGSFQIDNGDPTLKGVVVSPKGTLKRTPYHDLRAEVNWSPAGFGLREISLKVFSGTFHANASWASATTSGDGFALSANIDGMDANALWSELFPRYKDHLRGSVNFRGRLAALRKGGTRPAGVEGSGEAIINNGAISYFNLFTQLLARGGGASPMFKLSEDLPPVVAQAVQRQDTPFQMLKANFTVVGGRIRTDNFFLSTPDYTVSGSGWIGLDRSTKWNGLLVLSPPIAQALQREYKSLRYLFDRHGQLAVAFRVEGTLPNIKIRPESRALAQLLRLVSSERPGSSDGGDNESDRAGRRWLPESLDRLLRH